MRHGVAGILGIILFGWLGIALGFAEPSPISLALAVEQAKLATVGILPGRIGEISEEDAQPAIGKIRGSGFHIGQGIIVTVRHAVEHAQGGKVVVPEIIRVVTDDLRELPAVRQGSHAYVDVAVYQLQGPESEWPRQHMAFAEEPVTYGDTVFTVGYPLGWGPTVSYGRIGNPNVFLSTVQSRLVQVDLSACRGNSGGGLFNQEGQVVGLIHAIIQTEGKIEKRGCSRFAFALPGPLVQRVVNTVLAGKTPGFSVLGIHLHTVKKDQRWVLKVAKVTGPSRHAGFRKGDILITIDDQTITTPAQLKNYLIEQTEPGQTVILGVLRGDVSRTIPVTLGRSS